VGPEQPTRVSLASCGARGKMGRMEVLSSRMILRPSDPARSHRFYRDVLGLAVYREFGTPDAPGLVFVLRKRSP